jgi:hypothetical protein
MDNLKKTSPRCKKRRTMGRRRNILGSGATSIRSHGNNVYFRSKKSLAAEVKSSESDVGSDSK